MLGEREQRASADRQHVRAHRLVLGADLAVADDVDSAVWRRLIETIERLQRELRRRQEHLTRGATVDMHLLEDLVADAHLDVHGREDAGERRRGEQHVAEELSCFGIARGRNRDLAHVPDHLALSIEIGRADQEQAAIAVFLRDLRQHPPVDVLLDQFAKRRGVGKRIGTEQAGQHLRGRDGARVEVAPDLGKLIVVARAEVGVGGDERAGTDAGYDLEAGAVAARRPASEQAGAERAILRPAGEREVLDLRTAVLHRGAGGQAPHVRHVVLDEGVDVLRNLVAPEARGAGDRHLRIRHEGGRHGMALRARARSRRYGDQAKGYDATQYRPTQSHNPLNPHLRSSGASIVDEVARGTARHCSQRAIPWSDGHRRVGPAPEFRPSAPARRPRKPAM